MKITLKALRVNAGLNQKQAAARVGVVKETLSRWERHQTFPDAIKLSQLCEIYGCKIDDVFLPDKLAKSEQVAAKDVG